MINESLFNLPVYDLTADEKQVILLSELNELTRHHVQHCREYKNMLSAFGVENKTFDTLADFIPLAARLFKQYSLRSVDQADVFKTLLSSGTSGQPSTIFLDKKTAAIQSKGLAKIMQHWLGKQRSPMLIIDHPGTMKDRTRFSARAAGIQGMMLFGRDHTFALHDDMSFNHEAVSAFLNKHGDAENIFLFGFTYMIWKYFIQQLIDSGLKIPNGVLMHGGGWKKLQDQAVDNAVFKSRNAEAGIKRVHNYYGMIEQTGSIYVECENGHLHAPVYSDVLIRNPVTLQKSNLGEEGLIELLSIFPYSYPGHVLLTEDLGTLHGVDDCPCGRKGSYFSVSGRLPAAETRGCSDTYDD